MTLQSTEQGESTIVAASPIIFFPTHIIRHGYPYLFEKIQFLPDAGKVWQRLYQAHLVLTIFMTLNSGDEQYTEINPWMQQYSVNNCRIWYQQVSDEI